MPQQATKSDKHTLIEQGTEFKGTMKSSCPVVVNGRLEGELSAPELDITATGVVLGKIKAERLSSRGNLSGNIDAGDLFLSGSVGNKTTIKAKNLEVRLSPDQGRMELTIGECSLEVGDEPSKERRVEPSLKPQPSASLSQLPVTKSSPPPKPVSKDENARAAALDAAVEDGKAEAREAQAAPGEPGESTKPNAGSGGFSLVKAPQSRKPGARDSVPPAK
jgi:cytoskeletal protein CcmA (bactofilin family)